MIRVAQIMGLMNGGGVETVVQNYYRHIDRDKVQFDFVVDSNSRLIPREEIESLGGKVFLLPSIKRPAHYCHALRELCVSEGWRMVHSHRNTLSVLPLGVAKSVGVPVRIAHSHSTWGKGELKRNVLKAVLRTQANRYPTHRMACTRHAGEWLFGPNKDFTVLNNAIELDAFIYSPEKRAALRRDLGIAPSSFVVGNVGRLATMKNQAFLIGAFAEAFPNDGGEFLLLAGDGPQRENLRRLIDSLGLQRRVLMLGQRADVCSLYSAMDCFCLPSTYEGLGIAAIEAQVSGLPTLISTEVPTDAKLTPSTKHLPLATEAWSQALQRLKTAKASSRSVDLAAFSDYDIDAEAPKLVAYYEKALAGIDGGTS